MCHSVWHLYKKKTLNQKWLTFLRMPHCSFCGKLCTTDPGLERHITCTPNCKKASADKFGQYANSIWDDVPPVQANANYVEDLVFFGICTSAIWNVACSLISVAFMPAAWRYSKCGITAWFLWHSRWRILKVALLLGSWLSFFFCLFNHFFFFAHLHHCSFDSLSQKKN